MSNGEKKDSKEVNLRDPRVWNRVMKNLLDEIAVVHDAIKKDHDNPKLMKKHEAELEVLSGIFEKLRENNPNALKRQAELESLGKSSRTLPREVVPQKSKTLSAEIRKAEAEIMEELKSKEAKQTTPVKNIDTLLKEAMDALDKSQKKSANDLNDLAELEKMAKALGVDVGEKTPKSGSSR